MSAAEFIRVAGKIGVVSYHDASRAVDCRPGDFVVSHPSCGISRAVGAHETASRALAAASERFGSDRDIFLLFVVAHIQ